MLNRAINYLVLYFSHGLKLFSFIILVPHFTHIFSKNMWGKILIIQAVSLWFQLIVEFGFNLSGTRRITQILAKGESIDHEVAGIFGAKLFLSVCIVPLAFLCIYVIPGLRGEFVLVLLGALLAIVQGMLPSWYFLAVNKYYVYSLIDSFSRLLYIIGCFLFIKSDKNALLVFAIPSLSFLITLVWGSYAVYRNVSFTVPSIQTITSSLKDGSRLFIFTGLTSIYTTLNLAILGLYQNTSQVAIYGTADRITRASGGLLEPFNRVVFARLSGLYAHDMSKAVKFLKLSSLAVISVGIILFLALWFLSGQIVNLLSPNYPQSVIFIKILAIYIPVLVVNNILGLYIMIPMQMDKEFNSSFITSSFISLALMIMLLPRYGSMALAFITIATESISAMLMAFFIVKRLRKGGKT